MTSSPPRAASVCLAASSHDRTLREMAALIRAELGIRDRAPRIAASFVCAGGGMVDRVSQSIGHLFGGGEVRRFAVEGELAGATAEDALGVLAWADVVFVSGGDPVEGARKLVRAGADVWLRDARVRGVPCLGISAGSILLAAWWAEWPDVAPAGASYDGGELVRCAGVAPGIVVDCHAEADDWSELRLVRGLLRDRAKQMPEGAPLRFFGLPTGGGIVVRPDGSVLDVGAPPLGLPA